MRAIVIRDFHSKTNTFLLDGKKAQHLIHVARVKLEEEIKILDGTGYSYLAKVLNIKKKVIELEVLEKNESKPTKLNITVSLGLTKKESFELSIKQLVEIGIQNINILSTDYSQRYEIKEERIESIIESAMEQSNEANYPIIKFQNFDEYLENEKNEIIYFSSIGTKNKDLIVDKNKKYSLLFGPEGGLSRKEESKIIDIGSTVIHLPTNIMRTSTAVNFCSGYILGKLNL
jgi:16S rRNA (uracil1498-N3)-methyltransferase